MLSDSYLSLLGLSETGALAVGIGVGGEGLGVSGSLFRPPFCIHPSPIGLRPPVCSPAGFLGSSVIILTSRRGGVWIPDF